MSTMTRWTPYLGSRTTHVPHHGQTRLHGLAALTATITSHHIHPLGLTFGPSQPAPLLVRWYETPAGTTAYADSCPAHHHVPVTVVDVTADTRTGLPG